MNNNFYNIESGELYCKSFTSMGSSEFLFLDNQFDNDVSRRGVMRIDRVSGVYLIFN
jgi:hypothetical protein